MKELFSATLEECLTELANRSFYEGCIITPNRDGTYTLIDDYGTIPEDIAYWNTTTNSLEWTYGAPDEWAGYPIMEAYEVFDSARQIEHYLPATVETLRDYPETIPNGIAFSYVVVSAISDNPDTDYDELLDYDDSSGWTLVAQTV